MQKNRNEQEACGSHSQDQATGIVILDKAPAILSQPLGFIDGHAYAATWLWAEITTAEGTVEDRARFIVRDDGAVYGPNDLSDLGLQVKLDDTPPTGKLWSAKGVKLYRSGQRPDYPGIFARLTAVYDRFIDFSLSFSQRADMCELSACLSLATWLSPALTVLGYPWPNGEGGSGKTQWGVVWANTSYLGTVVLAK
jgi:hypothetical protein